MQMRDITRKVAEYLVNVSQCPVEAIEEALADAHSKKAAAAGTGVEHMFAEVRVCVSIGARAWRPLLSLGRLYL